MAAAITGVALITGAAAGIGKETGFLLAEAGARAVAFADIDEASAKEAALQSEAIATNPDYRAIAIAVDVRDEASVIAMVKTAVTEFERIDYNINCAGVGGDTQNPISSTSADEFDKIMSINTRGAMLCIREVSKIMATQDPLPSITSRNGTRKLGRGSIVNIASMASYIGAPGMVPYIASKHAVMGLTKAAAVDNARHAIRVNAVCPGWVDTPMMERAFVRNPRLEPMTKIGPAGRMALPEEVGNLVVFLSSPAASYINGTGLLVDGGLLLSVHVS